MREKVKQHSKIEAAQVVAKLRSEQLLQGAKLVVIEHGEHCYQLRVTKENKLILTK